MPKGWTPLAVFRDARFGDKTIKHKEVITIKQQFSNLKHTRITRRIFQHTDHEAPPLELLI